MSITKRLSSRDMSWKLKKRGLNKLRSSLIQSLRKIWQKLFRGKDKLKDKSLIPTCKDLNRWLERDQNLHKNHSQSLMNKIKPNWPIWDNNSIISINTAPIIKPKSSIKWIGCMACWMNFKLGVYTMNSC